MPIYCFKCKKCKIEWEAVFRMKENKVSKCEKCKKTGQRVFTVPQANIDTKVDHNDIKALTAKTGAMKGTVGDLWDKAAEMSDKRAKDSKDGIDPIKKKTLKEYAKKRKGKEYKDTSKRKDSGLSFTI